MKIVLTEDSFLCQLDIYQFPVDTEIHLNENGVLHRLDGPAKLLPDGWWYWYKNGKLHRDGGIASHDDEGDGWYKDGELHRLGGPAFEGSDGCRVWYVNGERHREDGPAIITPEGYKQWELDGRQIGPNSSIEHKWKMLKGDPECFEDFASNLTREMKEYICQVRPDLICKIPDLGKELRARYKHELELGRVDL